MTVILLPLFFFIKLSFAMARKRGRHLRVPNSRPIVITRGGYRK